MKIFHVAAFNKQKNGGNKAGVVLFADALSDQEKQSIAARLGYSETAFVMHSNEADFEVRFFTPIKEVDLCGHATIGTFNVMRDEGIISPGIYTQKTKAGLLKLDVKKDEVFMEQLAPKYYQKLMQKDVQTLFHNDLQLHHLYPIEVVSTGLKEIFLPMASSEALDELEPKFDKMIDFCLELGAIGIHAFHLDDEKIDAVSRNFAPVVGIQEESATGTSNGALACYLYKYHEKKKEYHMEQGLNMKQPSELFVKLTVNEDDDILQVWVGGRAKILEVEE
ncbi:MAG: PhzF family phenazine biosynthesis protein [Candidatus Izemoplasmataceae bacterium]